MGSGIGGRIAAFFRHRRAERALAEGRFSEAAEGFERLLASGEDAVLRVKRGAALWEAGDRQGGLREVERGVEGLEEGHPARLFAALIRIEEGQADAAGGLIASVEAKDPANPFARGLRGLIRLEQGRTAEAASLLAGGVFGSPLFRAHLLLALERRLRRVQSKEAWRKAYLEMVL